MPKNRSLHQSYQCLALLPYKRFYLYKSANSHVAHILIDNKQKVSLCYKEWILYEKYISENQYFDILRIHLLKIFLGLKDKV